MNDIKLSTKIFRDRETLEEYKKITVVHSIFFDGPWTYDSDEFIRYEDKWTKDEYLKLTNEEKK